MMTEQTKMAVLGEFLTEWPDEWTYKETIERLSSEEFYEHDELSIWEFYEDWSTIFLAKHIVDLVYAITKTLEQQEVINIYFYTLIDSDDEYAYFASLERPSEVRAKIMGCGNVYDAAHYIDAVEDYSDAANGVVQIANFHKHGSVKIIKEEINL